jgi:hypothetical protein
VNLIEPRTCARSMPLFLQSSCGAKQRPQTQAKWRDCRCGAFSGFPIRSLPSHA